MIFIFFFAMLAILIIGIILLLEKILNPFLQKMGDRLGMILFRKRAEREKEYMENLNITECIKENFCMPIDEVVTIVGVGTVVVGTVETGICREGEQAYLEQEDERIDITLGHIDLETLRRKPNGKAYRTEHIAVLLIGVSEEQVKVGGKVVVENHHFANEID